MIRDSNPGTGFVIQSLVTHRHAQDLLERGPAAHGVEEGAAAEREHVLLLEGELLDVDRGAALDDHPLDVVVHFEPLEDREPAAIAVRALGAAVGLPELDVILGLEADGSAILLCRELVHGLLAALAELAAEALRGDED